MTVQELFTAPLLNLFYRIGISGDEHLIGLEAPVIFASNHCLHTDNQIVMSSLPFYWRWHLSVAASAERVWSKPTMALAGGLLANAFPIAREGGVRRSLELLGARLDRRFSILIYPEGKLTVGGPMQPFLAGTGPGGGGRGDRGRAHQAADHPDVMAGRLLARRRAQRERHARGSARGSGDRVR